jgi:hypothetical protein
MALTEDACMAVEEAFKEYFANLIAGVLLLLFTSQCFRDQS